MINTTTGIPVSVTAGGNEGGNRKFLIIRLSSIGDIVLTTPVIRCLKQQVPGAVIHFLTKQQFRALVSANPYVDKVQVLSSNWDLMIHQLRDESYDCIIDLHHNLRTYRIRKALNIDEYFSFPKLNIEKWLMTALKIDRLPRTHIVDRYLLTVKSFNVVNDGKGLDYFLSENDVVDANDLPFSHLQGYIAIVIGAALNTKKLPVHKLKQLCAMIPYPVILLGGPEDWTSGDEISSVDPIKVYNACGKYTLNESADLVRRSKLVITHDTGLMHIAAAFKKPIVCIWGNTVPAFGMGPYYGNVMVSHNHAEIMQLNCRPCSKIGYDKCPRGHFKCMELQDIEIIIRTALSYL